MLGPFNNGPTTLGTLLGPFNNGHYIRHVGPFNNGHYIRHVGPTTCFLIKVKTEYNTKLVACK